MSRELRIFVPRLMDFANTNAQNLNARALLSRFSSSEAAWPAMHYNAADPAIARSPRVKLQKLWRTRLWHMHVLLLYQHNADAIFYPGIEWFDRAGLELRKSSGRRIPVIGTIEGLVGDEERERQLKTIVGHDIDCHRATRDLIARIDRVMNSCDHLIAITPMLAKVGRALYGDKVSVLPLGVDGTVFRVKPHVSAARPRVLTVATLTERKRPHVMVEIAKALPDIDFVWCGTGPLLATLRATITEQKITNLTFPGGLPPLELSDEYARADVVVLPSMSEGAPKALQEAAACGVPRIAFGHYEPSIIDGEDGFVVWSDEELRSRIGTLCSQRETFRQRAARLHTEDDWDQVAPLWEREIISRTQSLL